MLWQQQQKQSNNQKSSEQNQNLNKFDHSQSIQTNHKQQITKLTKQINDNQDDNQNLKDKKRYKNLKSKNTSIDNENDFSIQTKLQSSTFATVNYISPAELTTTTGSVLLLRNLTRADIDSVLTCIASHPLYPHSINGSIKLDINCELFFYFN